MVARIVFAKNEVWPMKSRFHLRHSETVSLNISKLVGDGRLGNSEKSVLETLMEKLTVVKLLRGGEYDSSSPFRVGMTHIIFISITILLVLS